MEGAVPVFGVRDPDGGRRKRPRPASALPPPLQIVPERCNIEEYRNM